MQKKLIALALASLAGTAFAQTNVTIYGVADATLDFVKTSNDAEPSHARVSTNSSYVGFKGTEELGNGLKAVFQFENGISFDAGTGTWASRDSYAGLAGGFGTIVAGNLTGPTRALGAALDVNAGATGIGVNSGILGKYAGFLQGVTNNGAGDFSGPGLLGLGGECERSSNCTSIFDTRFKNTIAYISPSWSGFSIIAAYIANENKVEDGINTWGYDLGAKYENGPIMVGLTYNEIKNPIFDNVKVQDVRLGGMYDFSGKASIRAMVEQVKVSGLPTLIDNFNSKQTTWGVGGTFNFSPAGRIVAQYYHANKIDDVEESGSYMWEVGYEHSLSKRTILKATYADLKNQDNSFNQFGVNPGAADLGDRQAGFQFGVRHSF